MSPYFPAPTAPRNPLFSPGISEGLARTTQLNAGLSVGLFQGKLQVEPGFYSFHTRGGILQSFLTPGPGNGILARRELSWRNQGIELALSSYLQSADGQASLQARLGAAHNRLTVLSIDEPGLPPPPGLAVGQGPRPYLAWQRAGLDATGAVQYRDVNGDGRIDFRDVGYLGNGLPRWLLNLSQQLRYRRWHLQSQLDAMLGYQLLSPPLAVLDNPRGGQNGSQRLLARWTPANPHTDVPAASAASRPLYYDDCNPESASHLRLTMLTLAYDLRPAAGPRPVQLWAGAQNLFVVSAYRGYDPNVSSGGASGQLAGYDALQYPVPRTWLLGLRATL